jgi:riboflavin kinase/FMN adenylyltransferase
MQVFSSIKDLTKNKNTILTLGTFDGIHPGHLKIIDKLVSCSKEKGCRNVVITFHPHPRTVLGNDNSVKMLTTQEEKIYLLKNMELKIS